MAITLAQAKELSQSKLTGYVIDEFNKSPLMASLPFDNTVKSQGGTTLAYVYNRISTQPTAGTRAINGEYVASETATSQKVVNLKVMGGAYEIDRVIANDEVQVVNHVTFQSQQKAKATVAAFNDLVINGDSAADATQFDGLEKIVTGTTTEIIPAADIDLSTSDAIDTNYKTFLYSLRKMIGAMDGFPTHILVNSDMYTIFQTIADRVPNIKYDKDAMGNEVMKYGSAILVEMGDKPGSSDPIVEIVGATGISQIYAIRVGLDGVHAVSPDGTEVVKTYLPDFKTAGAVKKGEVEFVGAIAVKATKSAAILRKIKVRPAV